MKRGSKRKTYKRKTYKRKTNKRKTNKRKTYKRKTYKKKTYKRKLIGGVDPIKSILEGTNLELVVLKSLLSGLGEFNETNMTFKYNDENIHKTTLPKSLKSLKSYAYDYYPMENYFKIYNK